MTEIINFLLKYNIDPNNHRVSSHQKIADILLLCEKKGIKLLSPVLIKKGVSQNSYVRYACECGNEAESAVSNFLEKSVFACKNCNAKLINKIFKPINTIDLEKEIKDKGYTVISHNHKTSMYESVWTLKCQNGHIFDKKGNKLKNLQSCPHCFSDSYEEFLMRKLIETHYKEEFPKSYPAWLINSFTHRTLELDMFSEKLKLAFEYNGIQHYEPIFGQERYEISVRNDNEKQKRCLENNVKLITIKYLSSKTICKERFLKALAEALKEHDIFVTMDTINEVLKQEYTITSNTDTVIKDLKKTLKKHKREWISGNYINSSSKIVVKCLQCNTQKDYSIRTLQRLKDMKNSKCSSCIDKFASKKIESVKRHKNLVSKICKKLDVKFDEFQTSEKGVITGFWYYENNIRNLFGCKKYKKAISLMK